MVNSIFSMGNRQPRSLFPEDRTQRQDPAPARAPGLPRCALKNGFGVHTRFCMLPLIERHLTHIHTYAHTHTDTHIHTHTRTHTHKTHKHTHTHKHTNVNVFPSLVKIGMHAT